jgi:hypothetical protein
MNTTIDRTKPQSSGNGDGTFELLETDVYVMEIKSAKLEEDQFGEPDDAGNKPIKLVLRWEDEESGNAVWQRFAPYYGTKRDGTPSKFMAFIDSLAEQGLLPDQFDMEEDLPGIRQRVSVEKYIKTMGANKGQPGNKVIAVMTLKRKVTPKSAKAAPVPATDDTDNNADIPF